MVSTSSYPSSHLVFMYDLDEVVVKAMERGSMHEWSHIEWKAICRRHGLGVKGAKGEVMERVKSHFQELYHFGSNKTSDGAPPIELVGIESMKWVTRWGK